MMTVSELIEKLSKCNPGALVEFAYEDDNTTTGNAIRRVAQFTFFSDKEKDDDIIVQLRG